MNHIKKVILSYVVVLTALILVSCAVKVNNLEYTIEFNSKTYEGKYTGTSKNNIPQDEGKFVCGNEGDNNYFIYDGSWENGEMIGSGTLITNNYTVHFPKTEQKDAVDRTGAYNGEVIDGVANGKGSFTATNEKGVQYTYTGEWKDGLFDGKGKEVFDDKNMSVLEGTFEKGEYKPTTAEFVRMIGTIDSITPYTVSDEVYKYISENEDVFKDHNTDKIKDQIKEDFSMTDFKKTGKVDAPYFIRLNNLLVHQVEESDADEMFGHEYTGVLAQDSDVLPNRLNYFGKTDKLSEGEYFDAIVMPLGYSTYDTVNGGKDWAFTGWIIAVE